MKLTITILAILLFSGCRATQKVYTRQAELNKELVENLNVQRQTSAMVLDSILSYYNAKVTKTERLYTLPDSTGQQAVISETEYNVDLSGKITTLRNQNNNQHVALVNDKKMKETGRQYENCDEKTDSRLFHPPEWFYVSFLILVVTGIIFYKKYTK